MAYPMSLPEQFKIVAATPGPVTTNGGVTLDYVSLKNAHKAWILLQFRQAASHATVVQPQMATAVAPTGEVSITYSARWWKNANIATSDTKIEQTAATSMAATAGTTHQEILIEIDPDEFAAGGYDVLGATISDSSQATNFVSAWYIMAQRYPGAASPSAIID